MTPPHDSGSGDALDSHHSQPRSLSRRRFLGLAGAGVAAVAGGWAAARLLRGAGSSPQAPGRMPAPDPTPVVVRVSHPGALSRGRANPAIALDMVDGAMSRLTGKQDRAAAWGSLFTPEDVVALKVNSLAGPLLATHPQVVEAVIAGLRAAGVPEQNIIIYDRLGRELERAGFTPSTGGGVRCLGTDAVGYDADPTEAGVVGSCLSRIVSEMCTAIINLPLVKDHDVAGVSIALKNHFGSIHNPNKQHEHGCCPQVADVNLFPAIRRKQRLVIADALTVTYDGGPAYKPATSAAGNSILVSRDPVATDAIGLQMIEALRRRAGLPALAAEGRHPRYIAVAADAHHNLGVADLARIRQVRVDLGRGGAS